MPLDQTGPIHSEPSREEQIVRQAILQCVINLREKDQRVRALAFVMCEVLGVDRVAIVTDENPFGPMAPRAH